MYGRGLLYSWWIQVLQVFVSHENKVSYQSLKVDFYYLPCSISSVCELKSLFPCHLTLNWILKFLAAYKIHTQSCILARILVFVWIAAIFHFVMATQTVTVPVAIWSLISTCKIYITSGALVQICLPLFILLFLLEERSAFSIKRSGLLGQTVLCQGILLLAFLLHEQLEICMYVLT